MCVAHVCLPLLPCRNTASTTSSVFLSLPLRQYADKTSIQEMFTKPSNEASTICGNHNKQTEVGPNLLANDAG